ncbi:integrase core domain-containing protein [Deinococcus alpinitundrae]|uniref:integrase core domain-containing protein n=1 Tax=Deinococcus alpinitundrae TaxID=468913 RepID=UPI0013794F95
MTAQNSSAKLWVNGRAHERSIIQQFNRPGKPVENAYTESFNGRARDECLNLHWSQTLP